MPTGKGTGRRDVSGSNPCAGQHQVTVFALPGLTITSFKSSEATERGAPAGEHDGQQVPPGELCCQPGNGAPGLHWKPLGGGAGLLTAAQGSPGSARARAHLSCPPVLPEALLIPGQHPSPPCGTRHGLQPTLPTQGPWSH